MKKQPKKSNKKSALNSGHLRATSLRILTLLKPRMAQLIMEYELHRVKRWVERSSPKEKKKDSKQNEGAGKKDQSRDIYLA